MGVCGGPFSLDAATQQCVCSGVDRCVNATSAMFPTNSPVTGGQLLATLNGGVINRVTSSSNSSSVGGGSGGGGGGSGGGNVDAVLAAVRAEAIELMSAANGWRPAFKELLPPDAFISDGGYYTHGEKCDDFAISLLLNSATSLLLNLTFSSLTLISFSFSLLILSLFAHSLFHSFSLDIIRW
jgi:hypothetical protein